MLRRARRRVPGDRGLLQRLDRGNDVRENRVACSHTKELHVQAAKVHSLVS